MRFSRRKNIDKQKTDTNKDSKNFFVDREKYTKTFNSHLLEAETAAISKNGMLLTYSGVGGVGKSALLKQFEEIAKNKGKKFIYYDFKSGHTEMLQVLKDLRKKLCDEYEIDFPLFDKGCIYLAQKNGDFVTSEQKKDVLESSSLFRSFKKNFSKIRNANDRMTGVAKIAKPFLEDTDDDILEFFQALAQGTLEANPALKFVKPMLDLIDKKQVRREEEARKEGNEDYKAVADELKNLNVKEEHIREKIIEVTGGLPYYIHLCCNVTYKNKFLKGEKPDFGENLEKVVERAIGSFDENSRSLLQKLCILGRWTGDIFRAIIPDHNPNVYKRLKSISVEESFADFGDGRKEKIYSFDRTIDSFLLPSLKKDKDFSNYFTDIRAKADAYFKKLFSENLSCNEAKFYFVMWSDIVLRTTDKPAELMRLYEENFAALEERFDKSTRVIVIQKFLDKAGDAEPLPQAYFQHRLGRIRLYQDRIKEAFELEEAAYSKIKNLPLSNAERPFKIQIMQGLAEVFQRLERYADEISLCREMISECERYLPGDIDSIIAAKNILANAFYRSDRRDDTIDVWRRIVETLDGRDDEAAQIEERLAANSAREAEDLQRCIESVDTPDAKTVELMKDRLNLMWEANADEAEKDSWKEKINETVRAIIEQTCREPVADYDAAIATLNDLLDLRWGYEDIALKRNILAFIEKKSDATTEEIIAAKKDFAQTLYLKDDLTDADKSEVDKLFKELENYYIQNLPASREELLDTLDNHAHFLGWKLKNIPVALEKYEEIFALLESDSEIPPNEIISRLESADYMLVAAENYSEELIWRERILNFCRAHLVANAPETLEALENLIRVCDNLNDRAAVERYNQKLIAAQEKNLDKSHIEVIRAKERQARILHCVA